MVGPRHKELTPLTRAQLDFASAMVDSYARGTKSGSSSEDRWGIRR